MDEQRTGLRVVIHDDVVLRVPATPAYVSLVRTAAATLGARLDVGIDQIDDLRLAVDEACALLLQHGETDSDLECHFRLVRPEALHLQARVRSNGKPLRTSGFVWTVLTALVDDVSVTTDDADVVVAMTLHRVGRP